VTDEGNVVSGNQWNVVLDQVSLWKMPNEVMFPHYDLISTGICVLQDTSFTYDQAYIITKAMNSLLYGVSGQLELVTSYTSFLLSSKQAHNNNNNNNNHIF
jgi:hypothetical protein